ncbi:PfkB family carbohydrate kinase [Aestuariivirga sp.]|uniref:PfkB family carbohydrate kinase n=1 Tax=Aestuariivirga sp. TaxID=2650926 RepID=UPI0039E273F8
MNRVSVAGSLHLDIMVDAPRLPGRDETLMGQAWGYKCGGKGGNQAVAAARMGADTRMGGAVGDDDFGKRLLTNLIEAGVDISCVAGLAGQGSGMSVAISEAGGEYGAVVVSGANLKADPKGWDALWDCDVLLLQNEIPETANLAAARAAKAKGARVVLNAAPARSMTEGLAALVDVLVVNRVEAAMLAGLPVTNGAEASDAARVLAGTHHAVIVTLGAEGLVLMEQGAKPLPLPAVKVKAISSHGAGDCFCGALAAELAAGRSIREAADFARAAAALFVSTEPAQQVMLRRDDVMKFL